ncbi:hypothetical protein JIN84_07265 [Luteolibacter yonseiensis]|uniref:DUF1826 domain-containing protein n=1 Tax=Luteolibacter yonseiensis TaxID=1144680 RepID=A0A934VAZ6_9BACT|nr:hypothetical protein [Luteolibacter yonseiensis]MBK1815406.1 hypothetical protein [Luteolibacter yonseiensis]
MSTSTPPAEHPNVRRVASFEELLTTPFADGVNALCWERTLAGDYAGVIEKLALPGGIIPVEDLLLEETSWSPACQMAVDAMLADLDLLRRHGLFSELNGITGYERDEDPGLLRTDVYSFHVDTATDEADTWLCTYLGPSSEGLGKDQARRRVDDPAVRAILLKDYGGPDDAGFLEYLADHCYDLHYDPLPGASPFTFGVGNLWRIAVDYPGNSASPCVHRAPESLPGSPARLLLIA